MGIKEVKDLLDDAISTLTAYVSLDSFYVLDLSLALKNKSLHFVDPSYFLFLPLLVLL
jgi:hypothetical protein